jgi:hypothetical protein
MRTLGLSPAGALWFLLAVAGSTPAAALTCNQQARICVEKGGDESRCKAAVPDCKRTGVFTSPRGLRWRTDGNPNNPQTGELPLGRR